MADLTPVIKKLNEAVDEAMPILPSLTVEETAKLKETVFAKFEELEKVVEKQEQRRKNKGRFYLYNTDDGSSISYYISNSDKLFEFGDLYENDEDCDKSVALKRHTYLFECPPISEPYLLLDKNFTWKKKNDFAEFDYFQFDAGLILPKDAIEEDKNHRIELVKKGIGARKSVLHYDV